MAAPGLSPSIVKSLKEKFDAQAKENGGLKPPGSPGPSGHGQTSSKEASLISPSHKGAEEYIPTSPLPSLRSSHNDGPRRKIAAGPRRGQTAGADRFLHLANVRSRTQSDTQIEIMKHIVEVRPKKDAEKLVLATHIEDESEEEVGPRPKTAIGFVNQVRSLANNAIIDVKGGAADAGKIIQGSTTKLGTHA